MNPNIGNSARKLKSALLLALGGISSYGLICFYKNNEAFYKDYVMPAVHLLDPETSHNFAIFASKYRLFSKSKFRDTRQLNVKLFGRTFTNPVGLAAGFDKNAEGIIGLQEIGFGFIEIGSVTPEPQIGNEKPRLFRLTEDKAVINRYGFNSDGHHKVFERLQKLQQHKMRAEIIVGVNLGKNKESQNAIEDYCKGIQKFAGVADYFVINVSSPNTPGLRQMQTKNELEKLLKEVFKTNKNSGNKPILLKLAPDLTFQEKVDIAKVIMKPDSKVDGIIISNTTINRPNDLNGQYKNETEKRGAPEPVRLQPSWEENNLPEDELNFKHLTMEDASLQMTAPRDKLNLVYFTFLIHGIGVLTPWNMFITASKYFTEYKLLNTTYATSFLASVGFASQVPNVVFNWLNVFVQMGGNLTTRIVWSITVEVIIFIITVILAMIDSNDWKGTFFWITMVSVVILNMANGIYQNTIFGMAAKLPIKYTGAVVLGSNISGTFTSIVLILSDTFASSQRMSAIYYFITALFVLLVCFDTYFALPLNRFYKHYKLKEEREAEVSKQNNRGRARQIPYLYVFRKAFPQLFNIFLVFFVTLSIFPAIQADVRRSETNEFFITEKYFTSITCFLTFNMSAMIGSFLTGFFTWPKPKYLWIPIALRIMYIPFFLLCNYQVTKVERMLPVVIDNEWIYWIVGVTMGLSSGYLSSLGMMYAPRTVESQYAATAGMFGAAALITGIFTGVLTAFVWPVLIANVGF